MPETATRPDLSEASQKERALWHMKQVGEIDRKVALDQYGIGRLAARIRDLKNDGYVIDSRQDDDGIAHYSLVSEPGGDGAAETDESGPVSVESAQDLWRALPAESLARDYVAFLARCAQGKETIGILPEAVQPEGASDWEAAACIGRDVAVQDITGIREKLCRDSPLVQPHGHRKGQTTYRLHTDLI